MLACTVYNCGSGMTSAWALFVGINVFHTFPWFAQGLARAIIGTQKVGTEAMATSAGIAPQASVSTHGAILDIGLAFSCCDSAQTVFRFVASLSRSRFVAGPWVCRCCIVSFHLLLLGLCSSSDMSTQLLSAWGRQLAHLVVRLPACHPTQVTVPFLAIASHIA